MPVAGAIASGAKGRGWAARSATPRSLAASGPGVRRRRSRRSTSSLARRRAGRTHILERLPGSAAFDRLEPVLLIPAPTHVEPHVAAGDAQPADRRRGADASSSSVHGAAKAADPRLRACGDEVDERRWPAQLARREGATRSSTRQRLPRSAGERRRRRVRVDRSADVAIRPAAPPTLQPSPTSTSRRFHATYAFPLAHTDDQVRAWLAGIVAGETRTWVAEADGRVVAMLVLDADGIDQLYVDPAWRRGIGNRLVSLAKRTTARPRSTVQVSDRARQGKNT